MNRKKFVEHLDRLARPFLLVAAKGELREKMKIDSVNPPLYAYWEALGRLLGGMAPWFECNITDTNEKALRDELLAMAHFAIANQVDPTSPDYGNFEELKRDGVQHIVDAAFLAQGFLRSPKALWGGLTQSTKEHVLRVFDILRELQPWNNNWILFSSEIECAIKEFAGNYRSGTVRHAYTKMESWYKGDGWYSDGESFALDYYNSLVIQPMLLDLGKYFPNELPAGFRKTYLKRALRHAEQLERMIQPDGSYLIIGRSLAYRCGAFHLLAQLALEKEIPEERLGQVKRALGLTIAKTLGESSYREDGYLKIGLIDNQPHVGETYICTGSLYLCSAAFLPLGLCESDSFWTAEEKPLTTEIAWSGGNVPIDHALH